MMQKPTSIITSRLCLEPFTPEHVPTLNAINNEPEVMEFLSDGNPQSISTTQQAVEKVQDRWSRLGYSWWAVMLRETGKVIGAACLQNVANVEGAELEIGWRLSTNATGKGYATEAGLSAAQFAFEVIGADHIIAVANPKNTASHHVMQRVGMTYRGVETHYDEDCTTYALQKSDFQSDASIVFR